MVFVVGVLIWRPIWLTSFASTIVVAFVTAVTVDAVIVKRRRRTMLRATTDARAAVDLACEELARQAGRFAANASAADPGDPDAFLSTLLSADYLDNSLRLWRDRVSTALDGLTLRVGAGLARTRTDEVDASLRRFAEAYNTAYTANARLHEARRTSLLRSLTQPATVHPQIQGLVDDAERARAGCGEAYDALVGMLADLVSAGAALPYEAYVADRVPYRLPPWLRATAGVAGVLWVCVLLSATAYPDAFPQGFAVDGVGDLVADLVVALFGGALAIAIAENARISLLGRAFEPARQLGELGSGLLTMGVSANPKLPDTLRRTASVVEDLVDAIAVERPNAELSMRGRRVVAMMRDLGDTDAPLWTSERDRLDEFFVLGRGPSGDELYDALWEQERAKADSEPRHPTTPLHNLFMELTRLSEVAGLVARGEE